MKCIICKVGETEPGTKTLTFEQEGRIVLVKDVPGDVCTTCGHHYTDSANAKAVLEQVEQSNRAAALEVLHFKAA